ncbi:MAG: hypothetical protein FI672_02960 [SAR202 cluster bacterium]|nr:hypothetical protein [SAR202 cluster bacterium]
MIGKNWKKNVGCGFRLDLRHTFASNLLGRNVPPKVVQEILGHQTISVTMDIYGHLMGTAQANALEGFKLPEHT